MWCVRGNAAPSAAGSRHLLGRRPAPSIGPRCGPARPRTAPPAHRHVVCHAPVLSVNSTEEPSQPGPQAQSRPGLGRSLRRSPPPCAKPPGIPRPDPYTSARRPALSHLIAGRVPSPYRVKDGHHPPGVPVHRAEAAAWLFKEAQLRGWACRSPWPARCALNRPVSSETLMCPVFPGVGLLDDQPSSDPWRTQCPDVTRRSSAAKCLTWWQPAGRLRRLPGPGDQRPGDLYLAAAASHRFRGRCRGSPAATRLGWSRRGGGSRSGRLSWRSTGRPLSCSAGWCPQKAVRGHRGDGHRLRRAGS